MNTIMTKIIFSVLLINNVGVFATATQDKLMANAAVAQITTQSSQQNPDGIFKKIGKVVFVLAAVAGTGFVSSVAADAIPGTFSGKPVADCMLASMIAGQSVSYFGKQAIDDLTGGGRYTVLYSIGTVAAGLLSAMPQK